VLREGRVGASGFGQRILDAAYDRVDVVQDVVVPEAQDTIALRFQEFGSPVVLLGLCKMLAAVQFDNQLCLRRAEVDNISADGVLSAELDAIESLEAQVGPQPGFG